LNEGGSSLHGGWKGEKMLIAEKRASTLPVFD